MDDDYLKILGGIGEFFVFQQLKVLPKFDRHCWRSGSREQYGFDEGNDSLGYDFEYRDTEGLLSGLSTSPMCKIEVKATTNDGANGFDMSINEWEEALTCHASNESEVYVIVRVGHVSTRPVIFDILIDPISLRHEGVLDYSSRNLLVVVGSVAS